MIKEQMCFSEFFQFINLLVSGSTDAIEKIRFYTYNPVEYLTNEYGEYCSYEEDDLFDSPSYLRCCSWYTWPANKESF